MKTMLYALAAVALATSAAVADPLDSPQSSRASTKPFERGDARVVTPVGQTDPVKSPVSDRAGVKAPEGGDAQLKSDRRYPVSLQRDFEFESEPLSSGNADQGDARRGWGGNDNEG